MKLKEELYMTHELDRYVTASDLAKSLGIARSSLYSFIRQGLLPRGIRLGRSRRWRIADVRAWLEEKGGE